MTAAASAEILVVEDDPNDLELMLRSLEKSKLASRILVARDGAEALDILFCEGAHADDSRLSPPELILLDLKLPKVDGLEVLRRIKGDPRTQLIPTVVLTSSSEQQDLAESYRLKANSFIVKPASFASFSKAVQELGMYWLLLNRRPAIEA